MASTAAEAAVQFNKILLSCGKTTTPITANSDPNTVADGIHRNCIGLVASFDSSLSSHIDRSQHSDSSHVNNETSVSDSNSAQNTANGDNVIDGSTCNNGTSEVMTENGQIPTVSVLLTVRLLMQGKEVGSIIGKRGDHVKQIRETSGAKVNISDGSCPERIVTITGSAPTTVKAFAMISRKFEEDLQALPNSVPKPPITMRLIVPATQCGSLIGKGGSKIREIREKTGASIQVATEMLPSSTERAVTISGTCEALTDCIQEVCQILLEAPPKGSTLPFRPKPTYNPLLIASSAAAAAAAQQQATQHIAAAFLQQQQQHQQRQQQQTAAAAMAHMSQLPTSALPATVFPGLPATMSGIQELPRLQPSFLDTATPSTFVNRTTANAAGCFSLSALSQDVNLNSYLSAFSSNGINGLTSIIPQQLLPTMADQQLTHLQGTDTLNATSTVNGTMTTAAGASINPAILQNGNHLMFSMLPQLSQASLQQPQLQQQPQFDQATMAALMKQQQQQLQQQQLKQLQTSSADVNNSHQVAAAAVMYNWQSQQLMQQQQQIAAAQLQQQQQQNQFELLQNLGYAPYLANNSTLTERAMTSNGTAQKVYSKEPELINNSAVTANDIKSRRQSAATTTVVASSRSKRFSPY